MKRIEEITNLTVLSCMLKKKMKNEKRKKNSHVEMKLQVEVERQRKSKNSSKIRPLEFFLPERRSMDGREGLNIIRMNLPREIVSDRVASKINLQVLLRKLGSRVLLLIVALYFRGRC